MFEITREEIEWGGRSLVLETGRIARQADGAVLATYGETTVLATVVAERSAKPGLDFFPLTVNYQEKAYAAGKVPGGYFKREGRPSEKETLVSRLIDRPIRPLFVKGFKNETQVIATVLSHDLENDPDVVDLACAEQQVRSYIAHWQHEAIGDDHADCQCEPFRFGQARLRIEIIGHPADIRTHDERPGTASDLAHQIIVEAQLSSSSHSSVRSTGVAGWIVETACL